MQYSACLPRPRLPTAGLCCRPATRYGAGSRHETVGRVRETMRRVFKLAVNTSRANFDPTATLVGEDVLARPTTQHRAAITEPKAFGALLRAVGGYDGAPETRFGLQLLALTALRPGELRQLRWTWVSEHGGAPAISLPAELMKMRRPHVVPLSKQAAAILTALRELTGGSEFVFPSSRSHVRPMSEGTLGAALRRLGYSSTEHVPHGFRSSFSTMANEAKLFDPDIIEAALAHDTPGVRGIYNRATYDAERRKLAQWWADHCDEMAQERPAKVVALRA
jgi:integrase